MALNPEASAAHAAPRVHCAAFRGGARASQPIAACFQRKTALVGSSSVESTRALAQTAARAIRTHAQGQELANMLIMRASCYLHLQRFEEALEDGALP
eukprot:744434-Pleurochrysis_carterae.AAC.2